jgi:hypothetical protein
MEKYTIKISNLFSLNYSSFYKKFNKIKREKNCFENPCARAHYKLKLTQTYINPQQHKINPLVSFYAKNNSFYLGMLYILLMLFKVFNNFFHYERTYANLSKSLSPQYSLLSFEKL